MKKLSLLILLATIILTFTSCEGSGESSFKNEVEDISILCVSNPNSNDFDSYITLNSGDKIVNDTPDAKVTTYHNVNGEKKVCLNSGQAHILRK